MRRASSRKTKKDALGLALLVLSATVIIGLLGFAASLRFSRPSLDPETLCLSSGPESVTVVIIDASDPFDPLQREHVRVLLEDLKKDVPQNGEVQLYTIGTSDRQLLRPELDVCNPGSGTGANPMFANPGQLRRRWESKYSDRVEDVFSKLLTGEATRTSPIMESIQAAAIEAFTGERRKNVPKRLVIISDMLQNTAGFSQYSGHNSFDQFKRSPYYFKVRPTLQGVQVEIYYLRRTDGVRGQGASHIEFWQQFFADAGATLAHVVSIEG